MGAWPCPRCRAPTGDASSGTRLWARWEPSLIYSFRFWAAAAVSQQRSIFKCKPPLSFIKSSVITQTAQGRVITPLRSQRQTASLARQPPRCRGGSAACGRGSGVWGGSYPCLRAGRQAQESRARGSRGVTAREGCCQHGGDGHRVCWGCSRLGWNARGERCGGFVERQFVVPEDGEAQRSPGPVSGRGFPTVGRGAGRGVMPGLGTHPPAAPCLPNSPFPPASPSPAAAPESRCRCQAAPLPVLHPSSPGGSRDRCPRAHQPAGSGPCAPRKTQARAELVFRVTLGDSLSPGFGDAVSLSVDESERGRTAFVAVGC